MWAPDISFQDAEPGISILYDHDWARRLRQIICVEMGERDVCGDGASVRILPERCIYECWMRPGELRFLVRHDQRVSEARSYSASIRRGYDPYREIRNSWIGRRLFRRDQSDLRVWDYAPFGYKRQQRSDDKDGAQ